jgi:hypothetical protein
MDLNFQKIIIIIALVLLIVILVFVGLALKKAKSVMAWPPDVPECPDYWIAESNLLSNTATGSDASKLSNVCYNIKDLGTCPPLKGDKHLKMDFSSSLFQGTNGNCAKYNWAQKCGLSWDGITYGTYQSPCDISATTN